MSKIFYRPFKDISAKEFRKVLDDFRNNFESFDFDAILDESAYAGFFSDTGENIGNFNGDVIVGKDSKSFLYDDMGDKKHKQDALEVSCHAEKDPETGVTEMKFFIAGEWDKPIVGFHLGGAALFTGSLTSDKVSSCNLMPISTLRAFLIAVLALESSTILDDETTSVKRTVYVTDHGDDFSDNQVTIRASNGDMDKFFNQGVFIRGVYNA